MAFLVTFQDVPCADLKNVVDLTTSGIYISEKKLCLLFLKKFFKAMPLKKKKAMPFKTTLSM